jgi:hypothetical protein
MNVKLWPCAGFVFTLVCCCCGRLLGEQALERPTEAALRTDYERFMHSLDFKQVVKDYPKAIDNLHSEDRSRQIAGLATLGGTRETEVIPWMVPLLDSSDPVVRLQAGHCIQELVTTICCQVRDPNKHGCLVPVGPKNIDLRPLAWVADKLVKQPDDGETHVHAATLIRFLRLKEFEPDLRVMLQSRHHATSHNAHWALEELGLPVSHTLLKRIDYFGKPGGPSRK